MDQQQITVTDAELKQAASQNSKAFLQLFMDRYAAVVGDDFSAEKMQLLTGDQHVLLSYKIMMEEIEDGGFLQLIQDGYGPYIFDNPFAKAMRLYGAQNLSKLIYKAKKIYDINKKELTAPIETDEAYDLILEKYASKFEGIEEEIKMMEEFDADTLAHYVDEHIELFAKVVDRQS